MRLVKRKKGRNEYYYLQHSSRIKNKVITKEIYLGEKIPENINEIKLRFYKDITRDINEKLEKIRLNFQKEWKKIPEIQKEKEKQEISIAFTYNTNAIEGSRITLEETREIIEDKIAPNKGLNDIKETEKHNKIFLEMLDKKAKITDDLILNWHKRIFEETKTGIAGKYREYLVRVGSYIAPDWQDVKKLMKELIKFINKAEINSVELAARAHFKFEEIHPFGDGNGRIGRLIINNILWIEGYPMLIIEYKKRKSYYKAFKGDEEQFVKYFIRRYLSVHKKRLN